MINKWEKVNDCITNLLAILLQKYVQVVYHSICGSLINCYKYLLIIDKSKKFCFYLYIYFLDLNDALQLWIGCRATRTLVDINTKCLSSLIHSDTEACISALLGITIKGSLV